MFYYGTKEWDGKNNLYEMFNIAPKSDADIDILMRYVPNYRINLIEPMNIKDLSRFKTDLQMMFGVLKCRQDKRKMLEYVNQHEGYFSAVDLETAYVMEAMLKSKAIVKSIKNEQGEVYDMCKALEDLYNDGVAEGELRGELKNSKESIMDFLFEHGDVPHVLKEKLSAENDLEVLKKWIKLSARASFIEEFEAMMDKV